MCDEREFYTFKVRRGNETYYTEMSGHGYSARLRPNPHMASEVDVEDIKMVVRMYQKLLADHEPENVSLVKVKVSVCEEPADILGKGEYLEERRRIALGKLQGDDIEALGLNSLATYNKLKFHKADRNGYEDPDYF